MKMKCAPKLDEMGPVNLVAIEEYEETEQRHQFLSQQYDDLINAKTELLEILNRIVMIPTHPQHGASEIDDIVHNISAAAHVALTDVSVEQVDFRTVAPLEVQKFDLSTTP